MRLPQAVTVVEVGPRDGLQNKPRPVSTRTKVALIDRLTAAGLPVIEAGSFVLPARVPQMADTAAVLAGIGPGRVRATRSWCRTSRASAGRWRQELARWRCSARRPRASPAATSTARSPRAWSATPRSAPPPEPPPCRSAATSPACSAVLMRARCRWQPWPRSRPRSTNWAAARSRLATPSAPARRRAAISMAEAVAEKLLPRAALAVHFHDTYGQALANILACLQQGIAVVDASVAGLGGCPFAPGAAGNVATEDVLYMLDGLGVQTGVDLAAVAEAGRFICEAIGRKPASKAAQALAARCPA